MGTPVSKETLAEMQAIADDRWKEAVERYKKADPDAEEECQWIDKHMKRLGLKVAKKIFAVAMLQLHIDMATETGELLGPVKDEIDPSRN